MTKIRTENDKSANKNDSNAENCTIKSVSEAVVSSVGEKPMENEHDTGINKLDLKTLLIKNIWKEDYLLLTVSTYIILTHNIKFVLLRTVLSNLMVLGAFHYHYQSLCLVHHITFKKVCEVMAVEQTGLRDITAKYYSTYVV